MKLPPVVIDTNVVVSGLITRDMEAPAARIVDGMLEGEFAFLLSAEVLSEHRRVLLRPPIRKRHGLVEGGIDAILEEIVSNGILREPSVRPATSPDRGDGHLWALVASQTGGRLVTGDRTLLEDPPSGMSVLSPRSLVDLLGL